MCCANICEREFRTPLTINWAEFWCSCHLFQFYRRRSHRKQLSPPVVYLIRPRTSICVRMVLLQRVRETGCDHRYQNNIGMLRDHWNCFKIWKLAKLSFSWEWVPESPSTATAPLTGVGSRWGKYYTEKAIEEKQWIRTLMFTEQMNKIEVAKKTNDFSAFWQMAFGIIVSCFRTQ